MDTTTFLSRVLPAAGTYFLVYPTQSGYRHRAHTNITQLAFDIKTTSATGKNIYFATAAYKASQILVPDAMRPTGMRKRRRVRDNVKSVKSFWIDIDCGVDKFYTTQHEAAMAIVNFCKATKFPSPSISVTSGYGLHLYWTLTTDLPAKTWLDYADLLKEILIAHKIQCDHACTRDICRILRPVGSYNRKIPASPKLVRVVACLPDDYDPLIFCAAVVAEAKALKIKPPSKRRSVHGLNEDLLSSNRHVPSFAKEIRGSCRQIDYLASKKGDVSEPFWYACIGVLRFTEESPDVIHEWSSGHANYSEAETATKIQNHAASGAKPTSCKKIQEVSPIPDSCDLCRWQGKIKSPISLGDSKEAAEAPTIEDDEGETITLPEPPKGFIRTQDGKIGQLVEGQLRIICDYDVYPVRRIRDNNSTTESVLLCCDKREDGVEFLPLPTEILASASKLCEWFNTNGLYILIKAAVEMQSYLVKYMQQLQIRAAIDTVYTQLGWKKGDNFVLGNRIYHPSGEVTKLGDLTRLDAVLTGFHAKGDVETWTSIANLYNLPGLEPYQFGLCAGFGAPLMRFTDYEGAIISMVSPEGGQGKTTVLTGINSIWGDPRLLPLQARDTDNAVLRRIGIYCNLPITLDEFSNASPERVSDFAYQITQGRQKHRLDASSNERPNETRWSTILVMTSNQSLLSRLSALKANPEAEALRVFEYVVRQHGEIPRRLAEASFPLWLEHYGSAGQVFIENIVTRLPRMRQIIDTYREEIDKRITLHTKERFWGAVTAAVLAGASIAQTLGLIEINRSRLLEWSCDQIERMRASLKDTAMDSIALLAAYLNKHAANRLVVAGSDTAWLILDEPRGHLCIRIERDNDRLYIDKPHFRAWITDQRADAPEILHDLKLTGALLNVNKRLALGKGTNFVGARTSCLEFDASHRIFSGIPQLTAITGGATVNSDLLK